MTTYLGLDVSKATVDGVLLRDGQPPQSLRFDNTPPGFAKLQRWLRNRGVDGVHACLEATGRYSEALALFLHQQGHAVSVVNPTRIKKYGESQLRRNKTDPLDAALIADFCRTQQPPLWTPPSPAWQTLQALVRHLQDLDASAAQARNRLQAGVTEPLVMAQLQQQLAFLAQQIETVKQHLRDHLDQHPDLKRQHDLLTSIPGIGETTANKLLAEVRDLTAFTDVRQLVAFAGLNPKQRQSGTSVRGKSHISRQGSASLRAALFMPALVAKRFNPILHAFALRLAARGLRGMALVVAVMRKLLHLVFGVLKSGLPFDPDYASSQAAFS